MSWNHIESGRPSRSLEVGPEVGLGEGKLVRKVTGRAQETGESQGRGLHLPFRSARPEPGPHASVPTCPEERSEGIRSRHSEGVLGPVKDTPADTMIRHQSQS